MLSARHVLYVSVCWTNLKYFMSFQMFSEGGDRLRWLNGAGKVISPARQHRRTHWNHSQI